MLPIHEYSHDDGCSVTGGFVYRGRAIEALQGAYLFADYCRGGIRGLQVDDGNVIDRSRWLADLTGVLSFGQDNDGELFVLLGSGSVQKLIAPKPGR